MRSETNTFIRTQVHQHKTPTLTRIHAKNLWTSTFIWGLRIDRAPRKPTYNVSSGKERRKGKRCACIRYICCYFLSTNTPIPARVQLCVCFCVNALVYMVVAENILHEMCIVVDKMNVDCGEDFRYTTIYNLLVTKIFSQPSQLVGERVSDNTTKGGHLTKSCAVQTWTPERKMKTESVCFPKTFSVRRSSSFRHHHYVAVVAIKAHSNRGTRVVPLKNVLFII